MAGLTRKTPYATDALQGVVELATASEANALSDTTKVLTAGRLPDSGASQKGIVQLATAAEVEVGTDTAKAVSAGGLINHLGVAKAWVNFRGSSTVFVRKSYNVSSVTDLGVGKYQINLTNAMADGAYVPFLNGASDSNNDLQMNLGGNAFAAGIASGYYYVYGVAGSVLRDADVVVTGVYGDY